MADSLDSYLGAPLEFFALNITEETIAEVCRWISGGSGLGGMYMISPQHWILC